ncbi:MAG: nucleotide pyrophosphohydrolase [Pseudomonadota bacterium]
MQSADLEELTDKLIAFRDERDWRQFHSLKNLILSLNLEASELLELTQWKSEDEIEALIGDERFTARAKEECADVLLYLLLIAERAGIDLVAAAHAKIEQNRDKYPVDKARGNARKYSEF